MTVQVRVFYTGLLVLVGGLLGCGGGSGSGGDASVANSTDRCPHEIKKEKCPFCTPDLVASEGFCAEHGVAEALCFTCRPYLKAAFRAKGDWCADHSAPLSQCTVCNPELVEKMRPGAGHGTPISAADGTADGVIASDNCQHGIAQLKCPFCTPAIVDTDGFCGAHNVAEALCVKCRPYLEAAFKAAGDWCVDHGTPESQCTLCKSPS